MSGRRRSPRVQPGSESGFVSVGTVIGVAIAAFLGYLLLAAFEADTAKFGGVPVPSSGEAVALPEGGSDVYYAEPGGAVADAPLSAPAGLDFRVVGPDGVTAETDSRAGDEKEVEGGEARTRVVGIVFAPAEATYAVTVESDEPGQAGGELTFGQSPFQAIESRFDSVVEELNGPTGIVAVVALVILFMLPRIQRALRRRQA